MKKLLSSHEQTRDFARSLVEKIKEKPSDKAVVVALEGDLGSGKTKFTQLFAEALGAGQRVTSPTFLIMKKYELPEGKWKNIFHVDAYRIKKEELAALGFKKITENPENIVVVEWADRVKNLVPQDALWLRFSHGKNEEERLVATGRLN